MYRDMFQAVSVCLIPMFGGWCADHPEQMNLVIRNSGLHHPRLSRASVGKAGKVIRTWSPLLAWDANGCSTLALSLRVYWQH